MLSLLIQQSKVGPPHKLLPINLKGAPALTLCTLTSPLAGRRIARMCLHTCELIISMKGFAFTLGVDASEGQPPGVPTPAESLNVTSPTNCV